MLRTQLWSESTGVRDALQAAMDPAAFQGLDNYMQVIEGAARAAGLFNLALPHPEWRRAWRRVEGSGRFGRCEKRLRGAGYVAQGLLPTPFKGFGLGTLANELGWTRLADRINASNLQKMTQSIFRPGRDAIPSGICRPSRRSARRPLRPQRSFLGNKSQIGRSLRNRQL